MNIVEYTHFRCQAVRSNPIASVLIRVGQRMREARGKEGKMREVKKNTEPWKNNRGEQEIAEAGDKWGWREKCGLPSNTNKNT